MTEQRVPQWQIVGHPVDRPIMDGNGQMKMHKRVTVKSADGALHNVDVPMEDYTPEGIQATVQPIVDQHMDVLSTQGPMVPPPQRRPGY